MPEYLSRPRLYHLKSTQPLQLTRAWYHRERPKCLRGDHIRYIPVSVFNASNSESNILSIPSSSRIRTRLSRLRHKHHSVNPWVSCSSYWVIDCEYLSKWWMRLPLQDHNHRIQNLEIQAVLLFCCLQVRRFGSPLRHFSYPVAANEHVNLSKGSENPVRNFLK